MGVHSLPHQEGVGLYDKQVELALPWGTLLGEAGSSPQGERGTGHILPAALGSLLAGEVVRHV